MKRALFLAFLLIAAIPAWSQRLDRPKLVVGIVVDQMRWDYLYRYYDHFGRDGFRRLMDRGFRCEQAFINYLPSYTAPGHASIYTGSVPAIHGITGNDWMEGAEHYYCTEDSGVLPVGGSLRCGQMSPRTLLTTTVTDELRLATNFRSRVYGISLKDRSSIFPAGHLASGAFWFDDSTGNFSTSTYYSRTLPPWVVRFNARRLADSALKKDWLLFDDPASYTQSSPDKGRYSGKLVKDDAAAGFPHRAEHFFGKGDFKYYNLRKLPAGNTITFRMARECVRANGLGSGTDPDFLCISLSSTDYAGHQFGPNALEMEDMFIRLDADLAGFLAYLDKTVGAGEYTVFLTADHGAAHNSLFLNDINVPAGNLWEADLSRDLNRYLALFTNDSATVAIENYQVYFVSERIGQNGVNIDQLIAVASNWLKMRPEVQDVLTLGAYADATTIPEPIRTMVINGSHRGRSGLIQLILKPGYYAGYAPTGTTHGAWNPYDTHIPLLWYGWGIPKGQTHREVQITDIAPTLSALLHIQMPNGCVGKVITEIVP
jgi:hypothetical protein